MPQMQDPNFSGTLTYICEHNEDGAMGIVINRPTPLHVSEVLEQLDIVVENGHNPVHAGGPVQIERGFIIHTGSPAWESSMALTSDLSLTTSKDLLEAIGRNEGPDEYLLALGYAGWGEGQLEAEIKENAWLTCKADPDVIFRTPDAEKFAAALSILGIDSSQLSGSAGHA